MSPFLTAVGLDRSRVGTGFRLGEAEAADDLALDDAGEIFFLLRVGAEKLDRHPEEPAGGAAGKEGGGARLCHFFARYGLADQVEVGAAVGFVMGHAEIAQVGQHLDVFFYQLVHFLMGSLVQKLGARLDLLGAELREVLFY